MFTRFMCLTKSGKVSNVQIDLTGIELNSYVYIYKTRLTCRYKSNCDDMICRSVSNDHSINSFFMNTALNHTFFKRSWHY